MHVAPFQACHILRNIIIASIIFDSYHVPVETSTKKLEGDEVYIAILSST